MSTDMQVAISTGHDGYPRVAPYSPREVYPEYPFDAGTCTEESNPAYAGVRDTLCLLRLDAAHHGRREWNPLGEMIRPGDTVVVKPNFIRDFRETWSGLDDCVMTHGAIVRAALDYVYIALHGKGRIVIADAPQSEADFAAIRRITGLNEIQEFYRRHADFNIDVYDLRPEKARKVDGVIIGHERLPGDPAGYVKVNLGQHSMFAEVEHLCHLLYGSEYDTSEIRHHHTGGVHEYLISKTVLNADCIINLPKLKTHKKTGITICMKNLVGINGNKNWLPHHRLGTPSQGGDQFADDGLRHRLERRVMACFRRVFPRLGPIRAVTAKPLKVIGRRAFGDTNSGTVRSGNWHGNDTTWRMVHDLNRILMYLDRAGSLQDVPARRVFCIVDGIVAGEGDGPLNPTPKSVGIVLAGANNVYVDLVCAQLMGFDPKKIPLLNRSLDVHTLPLVSDTALEDIIVSSNEACLCARGWERLHLSMAFTPHFGWKHHIERNEWRE